MVLLMDVVVEGVLYFLVVTCSVRRMLLCMAEDVEELEVLEVIGCMLLRMLLCILEVMENVCLVLGFVKGVLRVQMGLGVTRP